MCDFVFYESFFPLALPLCEGDFGHYLFNRGGALCARVMKVIHRLNRFFSFRGHRACPGQWWAGPVFRRGTPWTDRQSFAEG